MRIARARTERGFTQEGLASALDMATKNVQRLESGRQNLTLRTIERVAAALSVEPETFFRAEQPATAKAKKRSRLATLTRLEHAGYRVTDQQARRPQGAVPVTTLRAAAGAFAHGSTRVEALGWVSLPERTLRSGSFVAEVHGDSMAPRIGDGALCLFRPVFGSLPLGRVVLVEHRALIDEELGGPYVLKRLSRVEPGRNWQVRVTLTSDNPGRAPIVLNLDEPEELRIVAEFCEVLLA